MKVLSTWLGVFQQPVYSNIILNLHICSNNKRLTEGVSQWERLAGRKERRRPDFLLPLLFYSDIKLLFQTVFHLCGVFFVCLHGPPLPYSLLTPVDSCGNYAVRKQKTTDMSEWSGFRTQRLSVLLVRSMTQNIPSPPNNSGSDCRLLAFIRMWKCKVICSRAVLYLADWCFLQSAVFTGRSVEITGSEVLFKWLLEKLFHLVLSAESHGTDLFTQ